MGISTALFLIAAGAILRYAVTATVEGVVLETVGGILMIVGIIGLVLVLIYPLLASRRAPGRDDEPTRRY